MDPSLDTVSLDTVAAIVARHLPGTAPTADAAPAPDADLRAIGLDSIRIVALLVDVEHEFSLRVPQERIVPETFASVRSLHEALSAVATKPTITEPTVAADE
jgi:acyl carrier protein